MSAHTLLVKNMVCHRCVLAVEGILKEVGISYQQVLFGEIHLIHPLTKAQRAALVAELEKIGFELIDDRARGIVEKIKQLVIRRARNEDATSEQWPKLSAFLSAQLHLEYTYLSSLFSSVEGRTIEHYFIEQRIEKAKELLIYGELTLSRIALELGYSSTAHLSSQFKKVTGLTPSHFKEIGVARRKSIDGV
jgi:AraC-like DNA-binding protein